MEDIELGLSLEHAVTAYLSVKTRVKYLLTVYLFTLDSIKPEPIKFPVDDFNSVYVAFSESESLGQFLFTFMVKLDGNSHFILITDNHLGFAHLGHIVDFILFA